MPIYDELLSRLHAYAAGERTKSDFSELELFLAKEKQKNSFDPLDIDQALAQLVEKDEVINEDFAMGVSLIAEKLGKSFNKYRDALERTLFGTDTEFSPRSEFELASEFVRCGGDFGPHQLNCLTLLKSEIPELWIDLALDAYPDDHNGLTAAITDLFKQPGIQIGWKALKPRYLKLIAAVGNRQFNKFALDVSASLPKEEKETFLDWVNSKRGSKLTLRESLPKISRPAREAIAVEDIQFLTDRPCLARPVVQQQLEAA